MILAIAYENGKVYQHYGETKEFKLYTIENNKIVSTSILESGEYSHRTLATLLGLNHVNALICGNLGTHAVITLSNENIEILNGLEGDADELASKYLEGKLKFNPNAVHSCHH